MAAALTQLEQTPGYQFALQQGEQGVDRAAAAGGMGASGNHLAAADQFATGLAQQTYQQDVGNLQPYLGQQSTTAAGMANNLTNLGGLATGQGTQLANIDLGTNLGIGTANAQLAHNQYAAQQGANSNQWGAIMAGLKLIPGLMAA